MWMLMLMLACGEPGPDSTEVKHDVGRLCAAATECQGAGCAERYTKESQRMMSDWGRKASADLAGGADLSELKEMIGKSGSAEISPMCARLL